MKIKKIDLFKDAEIIDPDRLFIIKGGQTFKSFEGSRSHDDGESIRRDNGGSQHHDNGESVHHDRGDSDHHDNQNP